MIKNIYLSAVVVFFSEFLFCHPSADALELEFRPRLESGIIQYSIKYEAESNSRLTPSLQKSEGAGVKAERAPP